MSATDTGLTRPATKKPATRAGVVTAVSRDAGHNFTKPNVGSIELATGLGVKGDAHLGTTVQHRVRVREDPTRPNLRQVHLIHSELFDELRARGFDLHPGDLGENVTTRGVDLLSLPKGARLYLGPDAVVEVTGLRNPCKQIENFRPGLLALLAPQVDGTIAIKSGIMGIVLRGGEIRAGDAIVVELPPEPHERLGRV